MDSMRLPNGYGSVIKLGGKRRRPYGVRVTMGWSDDGRQLYKYLGYFEKKSDAINALAEYNKTPYDLTNREITMSELYDEWFSKRPDGLSKSTVANYNSAFKHLQPLYEVKVRNIRTSHLQELIDALNMTPRSKKNVLSLMKQLFEYAMAIDVITKNYSEYVSIDTKGSAKKVRNVFTDQEIELLWSHYPDTEWIDIPLILIYSGMRINELIDLTKDNVHLEERYLKSGSKTEAGKGEDGEGRIIPIHDKLLPLIEARMSTAGDHLIMSKRGKKLQYTFFSQDTWKKLMSKLNMTHTTHDCRATFASLADRTDANKLTIKRILGHSDTNITEHYTYKNIADLLEAVNKI